MPHLPPGVELQQDAPLPLAGKLRLGAGGRTGEQGAGGRRGEEGDGGGRRRKHLLVGELLLEQPVAVGLPQEGVVGGAGPP